MKKILLIDDDDFFHHIFHIVFRDNYIIDAATTADKVYEYIFDIQYDLIIVDISLHGKDLGKVIINEVRKLSTYQDVPIICCSAHSSTIKKREVEQAGADFYLQKPITSYELKSIVELFLEEGRTALVHQYLD